jgi:hypothetical protein
VLVHKTCFSILRNLVLQWGGVDSSIAAAGAGGAAGGAAVGAAAAAGAGLGAEAVNPQIRMAFRQFVFEQVVPVVFKCALKPHFDVEDAAASLVSVCVYMYAYICMRLHRW